MPLLPARSARSATAGAYVELRCSAAAARSSARSAPSSTCRAASRRFRTADDRRGDRPRQLRRRASTAFFITDDNFARNKDWEAFFDRLIQLREERGHQVQAHASRSTRSATASRTSSRRRRAPACTRVFIGLENINPDNLLAAKKRQNKITEYRKMLQAWKNAGVITYAGYILGFPDDTPESILRDIEIIKTRAAARPPRVLLPHAAARLGGPQEAPASKGVWMDPDLNKYDLNHVVHRPSR